MRYLFIALLLSLSGCTAATQTVKISGVEYSAQVSSGTLVQVTLPDRTVILVNRQGRPSIVEDVVKLVIADKIAGKD